MNINYSHIQTIIILLSLIIGYTVWTYNAKSYLNRILAIIVLCLVLIEISLFLFLRINENENYIYPSIIIGSLGISFFPTSLYTLSLYYPVKREVKKGRLYFLYMLDLLLAVIIVFTFPRSDALNQSKVLNRLLYLSFENMPLVSLISYSFLTFYTLILLILAVRNFIICFRCDAIPYERRTVQLLIIVGLPLAFFLSIVSIINYFFYIPFPWLGFIIVAFTFFLVILIFRFHLIDIRRFIYGVFFYPALIATLVFIYVYLIVRNQKRIAEFLLMPETITFVLEVFILYLVVMSIVRFFRPALRQPIVSNILKPIEIEALESLSYATSLEDLYNRLTGILKDYFKIDSFVFLLKDRSTGLFSCIGADSVSLNLREDHELVQKLKVFRRGVTIEELLIHLNNREIIKSIYLGGFDLIMPIFREDQIISILLLPRPNLFRRWSYDDIASLNFLKVLLPSLIARCRVYEAEKELERHQYRMEQFMVIGEMASEIAHEIRNPLSIISTSVETLINADISEKEKKMMLGYIQDEVDRMNILVNRLLSINFVKKVEVRKFNLYRVLERLRDFLKYRLRDADIELELDADRDMVVNLDENMLFQILLNLILNSIEAIKKSGRIIIHVVRKSNELEIGVEDTGPGIPVEIREKIFEPFFTTKKKGSGLGLTVTKRLVESLYGRIELVDRGRGAFFKITFYDCF